MKTIGVSELKTHCLAIVDEVATKGTSVLVSKRGKIVARIIPAPDELQRYPQDLLAGTVTTVGDIVSPMMADWEVEAMVERELSHGASPSKAKKPSKPKPANKKGKLRR